MSRRKRNRHKRVEDILATRAVRRLQRYTLARDRARSGEAVIRINERIGIILIQQEGAISNG